MAAYDRRTFAGGAVATTISPGINGSDTAIGIAATTGWPTGSAGDFGVVIDRGTASEEKVLIASRSGSTLTVASGGRGVDGTSATTHASGATIELAIFARDLDEPNAHLSDDTLDHHSQYLNNARHDIEARHTFGAALGTPAAPASIGTANSAGSGDNPAREDHVHEIGAGAIDTASMFAAGVIDAAAIGANAVGSSELADNAVDTGAIADNAVTTAKIADDQVTAAKIADGAIDAAAKFGAGVVDATALGTNAVTTAKIADDAVTAAELASTMVPHSTVAQATGGASDTTTSASFVDFGTRLRVTSFVKRLADTKLVVRYDGTIYNSADLGGYEVGVQIDGAGTTHPVANALGVNNSSGAVEIAGVAAGTIEVEARYRRTNGVGTVTQLADGLSTLTVTETF